MARNYSVEDVVMLRSKGSVSYEEAIRLLDKYDGDVASALIELEKSGQIGQEKYNSEKFGRLIRDWWNKGLTFRVLIHRKERQLVNLPVVAVIALILCAPRTMLCATIAVLICGGHILLDTTAKEDEHAQPVPQAQSEAEPVQVAVQEEKKAEDGFDRMTIE